MLTSPRCNVSNATVGCPRGMTPKSVLWSLAALTTLWQASPALAQSSATWSGGATGGLWSSSANWVGGVGPASGTPFNYLMQGTNRLSSTNSAGNRQAASITFQSGAGSFGITGGSFLLTGPISNLSGVTQTISSPITTTGLRTVATGSAATVFGGVISGAGGGMNVTGSGTAVFNAANTYTGTTVVASGATITGTGRLPRVDVQSGGRITPGTAAAGSYGVLTTGTGAGSSGGFVVASGTSATVAIGISGTTRGTQYDAFNLLGGSNQFGGTLDIRFDTNTLYGPGTTFNLFALSGSNGGAFGAVTVAGGEYAGLTFSGPVNGVWTSNTKSDGQFLTFSEITGDLVVVPEPSTAVIALVGVGLIGLQRFRRRNVGGMPVTPTAAG